MKNLFPLRKTTRRSTILITLVCIILVLIISFVGLKQVALWFDYNKIVYKPFNMSVNLPRMYVEERPVISPFNKTTVALKEDTDLSHEERVAKAVEKSPNKEIAMLIVGMFPEEPDVMLAIFTAESGLRKDAMGWNCIHVVDGKAISEACRQDERDQAWSVDCGASQLNFEGTKCPEESFNVFWNLNKAREMYEQRGKQPWVAYLNNSYKGKL